MTFEFREGAGYGVDGQLLWREIATSNCYCEQKRLVENILNISSLFKTENGFLDTEESGPHIGELFSSVFVRMLLTFVYFVDRLQLIQNINLSSN